MPRHTLALICSFFLSQIIHSSVPHFRPPTQGLLPTVIRSLVERRRAVKALMKTEKDQARLKQYDIRQQALKLLANR